MNSAIGRKKFIKDNELDDVKLTEWTQVQDKRTGNPLVFSEENNTVFLEYLKECGNIGQAAKLAKLMPNSIRKWISRGQLESEMAMEVYEDGIIVDCTPYMQLYLNTFQALEIKNRRLEQVIQQSAVEGNWCAAAWLLERKSEDNAYGQRAAVKMESNVEVTYKLEEVSGDDWRSGGRIKVESSASVLSIEGSIDTEYKDNE